MVPAERFELPTFGLQKATITLSFSLVLSRVDLYFNELAQNTCLKNDQTRAPGSTEDCAFRYPGVTPNRKKPKVVKGANRR